MSNESDFTVKDYDGFVKFIAEKSKDVIAPFNLEELCSEYKRESGTPHSETKLIFRVREIRLIIFEWETFPTDLEVFDNETKVKMLFALSAPVDYGFLEKLRRNAVVEVDEHLRITKYEKTGEDGFQLNGAHVSHAPLLPDDIDGKMLKVLAEISKSRKTPIKYEDFVKEYEKSTDSKLDEYAEKNSYEYIKRYIHIATEFDMPTRVKMLFLSGAEVNPFFLRMLRKDAIVKVKVLTRIAKYKANDGSLTLDINQISTEENKLEEKDENEKPSEILVDSEKKEDGNQSINDDMSSKIDNVVKVTPEKENQKRKISEVSCASDSESLAKIAKNDSEIPVVHAEDILKMLRALVRSLDHLMVQLGESSKKNLQEFLEKIDKAIEKMRDKNHKVPSDDMITILNASLHIVIRSATSQTTSSEDSASLHGFLWTLRSILITLSIQALDDFQKTINEKIEELDEQDKMVPIERIRCALKTVFALATA